MADDGGFKRIKKLQIAAARIALVGPGRVAEPVTQHKFAGQPAPGG